VKFAYAPLTVRTPSPAMRGAKVRYRPIVPIHILAPVMLPPVDACIDCAADDTVFPPHLAVRLGLDPAVAQQGQVRSIGGTIVNVIYAQATLLLSDGYETCEWDTIVGFSTVPMRWALLGHAGFLEFFDVHLFGARREAVVAPNAAFSGQHVVHASPPP
jgi:hypothetical protein